MDMELWNIVYRKGNYTSKVFGTICGYLRRIVDIFSLNRFDIVYVFQWVTPIGSSFFERIARTRSKRLVYDIEDNVWMNKGSDANPIIGFLKGTEKTKYLIRHADYVISSSPFLNEYCKNINKNATGTFISSSVDTSRFVPANLYSNTNKITIGWTGTFSSKIYLDLLRTVFLKLADRCEFKLRVIGNFDYELPGIDLEVIQWEKETEVEDLQGIDIGVYPLNDDDWVLGKSGLKAIQYMAFGLPTVATNVGTTPTIIQHLQNGWLVKTEDEWIYALESLISNPSLRQKLGTAARETIIRNYSIQATQSKYLKILNEVDEKAT